MEEKMESELYREYLNKNVVVVYLDGFKKAGLVVGIDEHFIKLRYYSGNEELINLSTLKSLKVDTK